MWMSLRDDIAENAKYLEDFLEFSSQTAIGNAGGIAQRSVGYARTKGTRDMTIKTISGLAKAFKVPPWTMLLPPDELKQYAEEGALSIIQNYFAASSHGREIIAAVAESHAKPHRSNPPDDPPEK